MKHRVWISLVFLAAPVCVARAFQQNEIRFTNIAAEAGIDFRHTNGASPEKYLPETMTGGAVILDYDNDGRMDLFFVDGGSFVDEPDAREARHRLYRNTGDLEFEDVSTEAGIGPSGYGMGACAADYDGDGWVDLYVTAFGPDRLYHNTGEGGFEDVTESAGAAADLWSASCAFGDIDNDGWVDLYVTRYVDFTVEGNRRCGDVDNIPAYCHPNVYDSLSDVLYRNNGDGSFRDVTREAGIYREDGNGLGVVFGDVDGDGWADIYVANDAVPNFLFENDGSGAFEEAGLWAGVAVGVTARPLAGMGTDMGDVDGDGLEEIFVTNLALESHTLYANLGDGLFADVTLQSGVSEATLPFVGFGTAFLDYDNDTDLDLVVANGDVIDNVALFRDTTYEQPNLLLENDGAGRFTDAGPVSGPGFAIEKPSRALAVGDLDNDGDLDIVVANVGETPDLLRNDGGNRGNALLVRALGRRGSDAIGARLRLRVGERILTREVRAGSSYLAQNDIRVHFGLGQARQAERLEISWPGGDVEVVENIEANQIVTLRQGEGVVDHRPFESPQ